MAFIINFWAILTVVIANFFFGFLWFTLLFGKAWGKEMGFDSSVKPKISEFVRGLVFMLIGNFFFAFVFAHNISAWFFVPGMVEEGPFSNALSAAIFTWFGFYLPGELGATVWQRHSWKLFSINSGYQLISLLIAAFILTYWR